MGLFLPLEMAVEARRGGSAAVEVEEGRGALGLALGVEVDAAAEDLRA